jgi:hypothetical protein
MVPPSEIGIAQAHACVRSLRTNRGGAGRGPHTSPAWVTSKTPSEGQKLNTSEA